MPLRSPPNRACCWVPLSWHSPTPQKQNPLVTVIVTLELLLPTWGSGWSPLTVAVLVTLPVAVGITLIVTVAILPLFSVPRAQVTVPPVCVQVPLVVETLRKVTPAGRWSTTVTPVAVLGPRFLTVRT